MTNTTGRWIVLGALMLAACSGAAGMQEEPTPPVGPDPDPVTAPQPVTPPTAPTAPAALAKAALVDHVGMFANRPAILETRLPDESGPGNADFRATTWVSATGEVLRSELRHDSEAAPCTPVVYPEAVRVLRVPAEHPTIQSALDAARWGDTVLVAPGVYHEHVQLRSGVRLLGSGAWQTVLDGRGIGRNLIDYSDAREAVLQGFTLRGVGQGVGCGRPDDPFACSGNWYASAIYGDGHSSWSALAGIPGSDRCADTSILVTQNVIQGNQIGMMAYFHARAVVRNNIFVGNRHGFVANHSNTHLLLLQNVFAQSEQLAIGSQAAYLDVIGNLVVGAPVGIVHEFVQMGRVTCNGFAGVTDVGDRVPLGPGANNLTAEQAFVNPAQGDFRPTPQLVAALAVCLGGARPELPWLSSEPGAFGGALGAWGPPAGSPMLAP